MIHCLTPKAFAGCLCLGLSLLLSLLLGGCASHGSMDSEAAPDDFVLGVTVYDLPSADPISSTDTSQLPRAVRPARYVIEADGVLRASHGTAASPSDFPPMTRRLTPEQIDRLWTLTRATGVYPGAEGAPGAGEQVGPVAGYEPPMGRITALIESFAAGQRASTALPIDSDDQRASPVRALTDALAELAWVSERPVDVEAELRSR